MDAASEPNSRIWRLGVVAILAGAAILFFTRLGERALWSEEVRWAQIPREMSASGDWFWPTINGRVYYDKPLGSYWLVLFASRLTGAPDETAARLPSAVCGLAAILFTMLLGRRLYGERESLLAGVILATSFSFLFFARTASADIENVAGILAALWLFVRNEGRPPGLWTVALWLLMALTSLTKGLLGFAVPLLVIGIYSSCSGPLPEPAPRSFLSAIIARNHWLFNRVSLAAIPSAILVYMGPFVASAIFHPSTDGLAMVYRENLRRFFDPVNHRGPVYLYGYVIFLLLAPWSVLLPAALTHAHVGAGQDRRGRIFTLAYFWGTFLFFTLSASRRSYYLLPILPAGAFLIARLLAVQIAWDRVTDVLAKLGAALLGLAVLGSGVFLVPSAALLPEPWDHLPALPAPIFFTATWLICVAAVLYALGRRQPRPLAISASIVAIAFAVYFYLVALPELEPYRTQKSFAQAVRAEIDGDMTGLGLWKTREIVYHLEAPASLSEFHDRCDLEKAMTHGRLRWLILRRRDYEELKHRAEIRIAETVHPWEKSDQSDSKLLLVRLID